MVTNPKIYLPIVFALFCGKVIAQSAPTASVEVIQASATQNAADKKVAAIKKASEDDTLFKSPLFEGKAGISLLLKTLPAEKIPLMPLKIAIQRDISSEIYTPLGICTYLPI